MSNSTVHVIHYWLVVEEKDIYLFSRKETPRNMDVVISIICLWCFIGYGTSGKFKNCLAIMINLAEMQLQTAASDGRFLKMIFSVIILKTPLAP